ncbi:MAG: hypothetical protein RBU45_13130 [Myxococcota bacterium]|nr:hypothetical protein [Myxococcota bacterium]
MSLEQVKKALPGMFFKDLSRFEPGKVGFAIGENLRIHEDPEKGLVVRFLRDTPYGPRKQLFDRLELSKVAYTVGDDFTF